MNTGPRSYEREFTARADHRARRRLGLDVDRGTVVRFVVQLEYLIDPGADEWATVVRYDHDGTGESEHAHEVTDEGLHIDVYRESEKIESHELTPPLPANDALSIAEEHLSNHLEGYLRRFEQWHGIDQSDH